MIGFSDMIKLTNDTIGDLTNIVNHLERHIGSYDSIRSQYQLKRSIKEIDNILSKLVSGSDQNSSILWNFATLGYQEFDSLAHMHINRVFRDSSGFVPFVPGTWAAESFPGLPIGHESDLRFLRALLATQDLLIKYHRDLVHVDYRLYEQLRDSIRARIEIMCLLQDPGSKKLSKDRVEDLHKAYTKLIKSLDTYKDKMQSMIT
jgi:hypothetical protein